MSSGLRRRLRQATAEHDWLEGLTAVLGIVFLLLAILSVCAFVVDLANLREPEPAFPAGEGFVKGMRGFGLVFFPVTALVCASVGWFLAGSQIGRAVRRVWRGSSG